MSDFFNASAGLWRTKKYALVKMFRLGTAPRWGCFVRNFADAPVKYCAMVFLCKFGGYLPAYGSL